jgi:hypothetical protein
MPLKAVLNLLEFEKAAAEVAPILDKAKIYTGFATLPCVTYLKIVFICF